MYNGNRQSHPCMVMKQAKKYLIQVNRADKHDILLYIYITYVANGL